MAEHYQFIPPGKSCILSKEYIIEIIEGELNYSLTKAEIEEKITDEFCQNFVNNYFLNVLEESEYWEEEAEIENQYTIFDGADDITDEFRVILFKFFGLEDDLED